MKKLLLICGVLFILAIAFSSCRKCETCKAYYRSDNSLADETEYCGTKIVVNDDVTFYEDLWNDSYFYASCN
jgi:hypothetical protein